MRQAYDVATSSIELGLVSDDAVPPCEMAMRWSPDGAHLAVSSYEEIMLWSFVPKLGRRKITPVPSGTWTSLDFSPDGASLLCVSDEGRAAILSVRNTRGRLAIRCVDDAMEADGLDTRIIAAAFFDGGHRVFALTDYGHCHDIDVPELSTAARRRSIAHKDYDPEHRIFNGDVNVEGGARGLALSRDRSRVVVFSGARAYVYARDGSYLGNVRLSSWSPWSSDSQPDGELCVWAVSPDGAWIAAGAGRTNRVVIAPSDPKRTERLILQHEGKVTSAAFRGDGRALATGSEDATVRLSRLGGEGAPIVLSHEHPVSSIAWSSDDRLLATVDDGGGATVFHLDHAGATMVLRLARTKTLAIHPEGRRIAIADFDGVVRVHDL